MLVRELKQILDAEIAFGRGDYEVVIAYQLQDTVEEYIFTQNDIKSLSEEDNQLVITI